MAYSLDSSKKSFQMTIPDDEFCCPLCMELLEEPKSLPGCAHSFCKMCINQMLIRNNNTDMSCPVCRSSSRVPPNGADGFPTNTLLVRLMDNIPGRNEKRELQKAVAACKEEIQRNTKIRDEIEKRCGVIKRNKEGAENLKAQVSEYAEQMMQDIKHCEQELLKEIDDFVGKRCGLLSENNLDKTKKKLEATLEEASNCVYSVEDILKKDDLSVILDLKTVMVEQLAEYSKFPAFTGVANREIRTFDLRLEKNSERENLLGKLVSGWAGAEPVRGSSSSAVVELERSSSQEDDEDVYSCTCRSVGASANSSDPPGFTRGDIVTRVDLPFEPFSIAVSPHSGDVALLWKENNKVFLCKANGQHYSTISIKYGDLWDVGFTIDNHVIVVNRRNNRLLCYTKDGHFVSQEREIPRADLKYTYLSVCEDGRLIVTSACTDDDYDDDESDDDDEIVRCIIVYEADESSHKIMFGRKHLDNPISRAVFHRGYYYIADAGGRSTVSIRQFSSQGQFLQFFNDAQPSLHASVSLSIDTDFDRLIVGKHHPSMLWKQDIFGSSYSLFGGPSPHNCPHDYYIHRQEILPRSFHWQCYAGILKIEIYRDLQFFNIVHYY